MAIRVFGSAVRQLSVQQVRLLTGAAGLAVLMAATGCQSQFNGQTLPSAWWQTDDVQYFPAGAEFKLAREAAAMKAAQREAARGGRPLGASPSPKNPLPPAPAGAGGAPAQPLAPPAGDLP